MTTTFTIRSTYAAGVTLYAIDSPQLATRINGANYVNLAARLPAIDPRFAPLVAAGYQWARVGSILSPDSSNSKLAKSAKEFGANWFSAIHYGAPFNASGYHACSHASKACAAFCLFSAGQGFRASVKVSRIARTALYFTAPRLFGAQLLDEAQRFQWKARRNGQRLAIRLNGTTDLMGPVLSALIDTLDYVTFYDYTAVPSRVEFASTRPNYHITLSRKETESNRQWIVGAPAHLNCAVVVTRDCKAQLLSARPDCCVDGDKHDLRLPTIDGVGKLILLTPKGTMRGKATAMVNSDPNEVLSLRPQSTGVSA
jgi:hypothetical protein